MISGALIMWDCTLSHSTRSHTLQEQLFYFSFPLFFCSHAFLQWHSSSIFLLSSCSITFPNKNTMTRRRRKLHKGRINLLYLNIQYHSKVWGQDFFLKKINTFIKQQCIKFIKSDFHIVTNNSLKFPVLLNILFIKESSKNVLWFPQKY